MVAIAKKIQFLLVPNLLGYCGFFIMLSLVFYAAVYGDFLKEGSILTQMPWGLVSLVDIYLGLILFSSWVIWREENKRNAIIWALSILALGNMISCLYVLKAAYDSDGHIITFWLGKEKSGNKNVL
ncbi:MAG: hypothetical protein ACI9ZT_001255 [Gammaproteobacteria bacterium]|jgi:hypothetical protein